MKDEIPEFIKELSQQLNTQDNRITADPIFCVYYDEKVPTAEEYADGYEFHNEDGYLCDDETELLEHLQEYHPELIAKHLANEEIESVDDWDFEFDLDHEYFTLPEDYGRLHYLKKKHFVKASLTEAGAKQFIERKQHDYPKLYIYAESMCYQWQMIELRKWLMSLTQK